MYININKTFDQIKKYLTDSTDLCKAYESTLRLQSQLLALIYDAEAFSAPAGQERLANSNSFGQCNNGTVTLVLEEPLPSMKRLTEAVEEHWKAMIHAAISKTAQQESLPYFEKAMVEIEIVTPKGTNNAQAWDTSNRAIQLILNNLKGIFFRDDDLEHMAFSVVGKWSEKGVTIIRISAFDK